MVKNDRCSPDFSIVSFVMIKKLGITHHSPWLLGHSAIGENSGEGNVDALLLYHEHDEKRIVYRLLVREIKTTPHTSKPSRSRETIHIHWRRKT